MRYAELELRFSLGGMEHKISAITSLYGAIKVFDFDSAKAVFGDLLGKVIRVQIGKLIYEMYFTREFNSEGRFFHLKFLNMDEAHKVALIEVIERHGIAPPWKRIHPRLDAITNMERVDVPSLAVVHYQSNIEVYRVLNFTLGGALLESSNPTYEPSDLGQAILLDLRISNGEELTKINGRIMRIGVEKLPDLNHRLLSLGVKIVYMKPDDLEKYRYLIRTYCEVLKS